VTGRKSEHNRIGFDRKAASVTFSAAVTLLVLAGIYVIRGTLVLFAIALLLAYLLHPLVGQVSRLFGPKNRTLALAITYVIVMALLAGVGIAIGSRVAAEARQLIAEPPDIPGFFASLGVAHPALAPVLEPMQGQVSAQLGDAASALPRVSLSLLAASANLIYLIVIPILSFFILKDGARIRDSLLDVFSAAESRDNAERLLAEANVLLLQYMRALLVLCCTALVVLGAGMAMAGIRYALLLAAIAFFCEFVPMAGPIVEIAVILGVSALTGYPHILALAACLGVFRLVQDYVIWPRLMSHGVELHPLLVIFGIFAGGNIGGVAGVFLAVPVLALGRLALFPAKARQLAAKHH
jgi:predicted PurR-regulated permease PerM